MTRSAVLAAATAVALSIAGQARAELFTFTAQDGKHTTFQASTGNVTASFTSPDGRFDVENSNGFYATLSGDVLTNNAGATPSTLVITFSHAISAISLDFAIGDLFGSSDDSLHYVAGKASGDVFGTQPLPVSAAEGLLTYVGAPITRLTLTSDYTFAIDNLSVPEPATFAVLGAGLIGLLAARRRRA